MEVTVERMLTEVGRMALELRLKDQSIAALEAEVSHLREQVQLHAGDHAPEPG